MWGGALPCLSLVKTGQENNGHRVRPLRFIPKPTTVQPVHTTGLP